MTGSRVGPFPMAGALALVAAVVVVGVVVERDGTSGATPSPSASGATTTSPTPAASPSTGPAGSAVVLPAGLRVSDAGFTLAPLARLYAVEKSSTLRFTVVDYTGQVVRDFRGTPERQLHLSLVRRDLTDYQFVYPTMAPDGTWSAEVRFAGPGTYRMLVDMAPAALADRDSLVLGADLFVSGRTEPEMLGPVSTTDTVEGTEVAVTAKPVAGREGEFLVRLTEDEDPVEDLHAVLGSYGHLVALREGDLAYVDVRPTVLADPGKLGGPEVAFRATLPSVGRYALFFDFRRGDTDLTADFVVRATRPVAPASSSPSPSPSRTQAPGAS